MSKIEEFQIAKQNAKNIRKNYLCATGQDDPRNDKHNLYARFIKCGGDYGDATMIIHAHYGYYGSSSGYSAMDEVTARYLEKAITDNLDEMFKIAASLAEKDLEEARLAAEAEAKEVLNLTRAEKL